MLTTMRNPVLNEQLLACSDVACFQREIERFTDEMSFNSFAVLGVLDGPAGPSFTDLALKLPEPYLRTYLDRESGAIDPVMQHVKHAWSPMWWDEAYYTAHDRRVRWETMASCGMQSGAILALHMPAGRHVVLGIEQPRPVPADPAKRQETLAALTLFATYMAEPALAIMCGATEKLPALTPQEVECLKWRGEGKSAWETAMIMNLSASRITKISAAATRKLDCITTSQAALKALRNGLLG